MLESLLQEINELEVTLIKVILSEIEILTFILNIQGSLKSFRFFIHLTQGSTTRL